MHLLDSHPLPGASLIGELIGSVYDGVLEQPPWGTMLTKLRSALQANWAVLILRPPRNGALAQMVNAGPKGIGLASERVRTAQAFSQDLMVSLPPGEVRTVDEQLAGRSWADLEYLQLLERPAEVRFVLAANIRTADDVDYGLRVCRSELQGDFNAADKSLCQLLLPHLQRAFEMHLRLTSKESESRLYNSTVDRLLVGTIVFDMDGQIQRVNEVANAILTDRDGLSLEYGRLRAHYVEEDRRLQTLLRQALADARSGRIAAEQTLAITRLAGGPRLTVIVRNSPIGEWSQAQRQSAVLLLLHDPSMRAQVSTEALSRSYGLTQAEAHLCIHLIEGLTLDEASERLGIRKNTARAHLRAIFSKTHVTRQSALVSRLMAGTRGF